MNKTDETPLNVLIACLLFKGFTGSEMYVYELAKELIKLNCNVTVASPNLGPKMSNLAQRHGIKTIELNDVIRHDYDIIHCQHLPIVNFLIQIKPHVKKICTIHSEVMSHNLEDPARHETIKHYIAIRPEIKDHLIKNFNISENDISVIYNPIDCNKFKPKDVKQHDAVLFVGTLDYLRKNMLFDLVDYTKQTNKVLWIVGDNNDVFLNELLKNSHVKYSPAIEDVEEYTQRCSETAGILLGRTTIEGWMCQKPGWIYDTDHRGNILSKRLEYPPDQNEVKCKFWSSTVAKQIKNKYLHVLAT